MKWQHGLASRRQKARVARAVIYFSPQRGAEVKDTRHQRGTIAKKKLEPRKVPDLGVSLYFRRRTPITVATVISCAPRLPRRRGLRQDKPSTRVGTHCASGWAEICGAAEVQRRVSLGHRSRPVPGSRTGTELATRAIS